jgi:hypothetical protein
MEKDLENETKLTWKCFQEVSARTTKARRPKTMICLEHMRSHYFEYLDFMNLKLQ